MESAVGLKGFKGVVVVVMLAMFAQSVIAATDPIEVDALKSFFLAIGDPMKRLSNWNKGDPCVDQWAGVFCLSEDKEVDHIHELRLLNMNLTGTLAPDLGNLTRLFTLDVMWNNITGSIPEEIGNLKSLSLLLLNGNKLTGVLPESLGNLTNLNRLQIDQNNISGPVPTSFQYLNKTRHFHMNNNSLTGIIPPELGKLQSLAHLLLDNNNLSGPLPPEISNIPTLTILQLDNNRFHGRIPSEYSNMYKLRKMSLRNCSLNGTIPDLTKISNLTYLDLSHNQLTGALPSGKLADTLVTIDLSYNQLEGPVPSNFSDMPKLQFLLLRNNFLNGTVPANLDNNVIFDSPTYRLILDFQYNNFSKSDFKNYPGNVTFLLYGNQACNNSTKPECRSTDVNLNDISLISSIIQVPVGCSEDTCDPSLNQQLVYGLLKTGQCRCASPLLVELRLKSPGFAYFPPYENGFDLYLSSGLNLSLYQVNVSSYHWEAGPRLFMTIALFPTESTHQFNDSEVRRLYTSFSNWLIPDSITFGPYELMSFPLPFPYNLTFGIGPAHNNLSNGAISGIVIGAVILTAAVVAVTMFLFLRKRSHHKAKNIRHERIKVSGVKDFTFEEMAKATSNFNDSMQVGQGGYGKVYRGVLADGQIVAIKRAQEGSLQGANEFYTEIELLSRVHHRNLVSLVGFCDDQEEQMLVYEFIANGTLRDHLSAHTKRPIDFRTRLQIALGSARGILYLHTEANPPIYHRDIKASNILLDDKNKAKVADFGLSRLAPINDMEGVAPGHVSTVVKGTPGYLDPEYFLTHKLTDKSDVYSFGVVLLELVTGMQPISHGKNIVREVKLAYDAGMMLSIIDPRMGSYPSESVEPFVRLAIACCKDDTDARPSMAEVVRDLEDIWQITPWSDSLTSFEASVDLNDMKNMKINALNNPYVSSDIDGSDLLSGTIPNVAPR